MSYYDTIKNYYGTEPIKSGGCHIFVSDAKREFSVFHRRWNAQLTFMDIDHLRTTYDANNEFLPPSIRDIVITCLSKDYLNKRLMWKAYFFLGTTAVNYSDT